MPKPTKSKRLPGKRNPAKKVRSTGKQRAEKPARKNHYLYQSKLDRAKAILGAATETEALNRALDLVIYAETMAQGTESMAGEEYHDVLDLASEVPPEV